MPPVILRGLDTSYDDVSLADARRVREAGFEVAWQCLWTGAEQPPHRVTNLRNYQQAGMILLGYGSLPTNATVGGRHVEMSRGGVPDDLWAAMCRAVVDVELPGITRTAIRQMLEGFVAFGKPLRTIYTSLDAWKNKLGNPMEFAHCDLINAWWDEDEDRDFDGHRYGPWAPDQVIAEQWSGGKDVLGIYADKDAFYISRERLVGKATEAIVEASTGLLQLRIAYLESVMKIGAAGSVQQMAELAKYYGAK